MLRLSSVAAGVSLIAFSTLAFAGADNTTNEGSAFSPTASEGGLKSAAFDLSGPEHRRRDLERRPAACARGADRRRRCAGSQAHCFDRRATVGSWVGAWAP